MGEIICLHIIFTRTVCNVAIGMLLYIQKASIKCDLRPLINAS